MQAGLGLFRERQRQRDEVPKRSLRPIIIQEVESWCLQVLIQLRSVKVKVEHELPITRETNAGSRLEWEANTRNRSRDLELAGHIPGPDL
jgi:hypothetical protein